jgi:peroxiredoxin
MAATPGVGDIAPDFTLSRAADGTAMRLSDATASGRVALIILRGYPGYQCPYCNRQAQDLIRNAKSLRGLRVIMVYPGPSAGMDANAKEFLAGKTFPENFELLVDPDYKVTLLYGLRWNKQGETAYPSTFLIDQRGKVTFVKVSREHGDRTTAAEIARVAGK